MFYDLYAFDSLYRNEPVNLSDFRMKLIEERKILFF